MSLRLPLPERAESFGHLLPLSVRGALLNGPGTSRIRLWREHPARMVRELFHVEPDPWQEALLEAFPHHNRLVGSACKGPGKTAGLAWLGWNFLLTRPHCKVPCTSITQPNLRDGLWAEFAKWRNRAPLLAETFDWTAERISMKEHPATWFASARAWSRDQDPLTQSHTLAGLHEDFLLFLIDECSEIPTGVVAAAEAALTGGVETKLVMMGNPTRTDGPLWDAVVVDKKLWFVVKITGDPDDPNRSPRIDIDEARRMIEKYGRDSYVVRVNILGEFPAAQADKLVGSEELAAAMSRTLHEESYRYDAKVIGVDCARFGDDRSVLIRRQGKAVSEPREFYGLRTNELGDQILRDIDEWGKDQIQVAKVFIDETGMGAGVVDHCLARGYGKLIEGVNFGSRAIEPDSYENRRTEMYFRTVEAIRQGEALPHLPKLAEELVAPIYWFDKKGRRCLEGKDEIRKRLGRSPDLSDAYVLTHAGNVAAPDVKDILPYQPKTTGKCLTEYAIWGESNASA